MPRTLSLAALTVCGLVTLVAGSCGDDADSASGFASAYCDLLKPCCAMANLSTDGKQCQLLFGAFGGQARYDKAAGEACLAETRAIAGSADFCTTGLDVPACDRVFVSGGKKQPGETCTDDEDCAPSSEGEVTCDLMFGTGGAQIRKCQVQVKGKEGDKPCVATKDGNVTSGNVSLDDIPPRGYVCHVADGLRCDSITDSCVKLKLSGEACSGADSECVRTAYCDDDQMPARCADRKVVGASCTPSFDSGCAAGAWCSDSTRMCAAQVALGAACTQSGQCLSGNCVNGKCARSGLEDFALSFICGSK
jgi:hypothetical protein